MRTRPALALLLTAMALAALTAAIAGAAVTAGAPTPETGPLATPGVTYSGDTSSDTTGGALNINCCRDITRSEWWTVQLTNGEQVLIKGGATSRFKVMIYQPGTTSLKIKALNAQSQYLPALAGEDLTTGVLYKARLTGSYPFVIGPVDNGEGTDGPFNFTATVYHDAFLFAPPAVTASTIRTNSLSVSVRDKEGTPISDQALTVTLNGLWKKAPGAAVSTHQLASGHPANGKVRFRYVLPGGYKGGTLRLVISATGAGYQPVHYVSAKLTVTR